MGDEQIDIEEYVPRPNGTAAKAIAASHERRRLDDTNARLSESPSLHKAVFKAIEALPPWVKAEKSGHNAKYAPLKDILKAVREEFDKQGIRIRQGVERGYPMENSGGKGRIILVYTDFILVETGEVERTSIEIPVPRLDPQGMGSAITYGRRYCLLCAAGLASDEADDDGAKARASEIGPAERGDLLKAMIAEIRAVVDKGEAAGLIEWKQSKKSRENFHRLSDDEKVILGEEYRRATEDIMDPA